MGSALKIILLLGLVWFALEYYLYGSQDAFGGMLVKIGLVPERVEGSEDGRPITLRAEQKLKDAYQGSLERTERLVERGH